MQRLLAHGAEALRIPLMANGLDVRALLNSGRWCVGRSAKWTVCVGGCGRCVPQNWPRVRRPHLAQARGELVEPIQLEIKAFALRLCSSTCHRRHCRLLLAVRLLRLRHSREKRARGRLTEISHRWRGTAAAALRFAHANGRGEESELAEEWVGSGGRFRLGQRVGARHLVQRSPARRPSQSSRRTPSPRRSQARDGPQQGATGPVRGDRPPKR